MIYTIIYPPPPPKAPAPGPRGLRPPPTPTLGPIRALKALPPGGGGGGGILWCISYWKRNPHLKWCLSVWVSYATKSYLSVGLLASGFLLLASAFHLTTYPLNHSTTLLTKPGRRNARSDWIIWQLLQQTIIVILIIVIIITILMIIISIRHNNNNNNKNNNNSNNNNNKRWFSAMVFVIQFRFLNFKWIQWKK